MEEEDRDRDRDEGEEEEEAEAKVKEGEEPLSKLEEALSKELILNKKEPLRQYGYDIFTDTVEDFVQLKDIPVGPDYILGPGDSFIITLWGITEGLFEIEVNRDGSIILPKIGMVNVAGLTYAELKPFIEKQLGKYYESVNVGITISKLRSIQVYLVGDVAQPGSYTLSSLSTVFNALFSAGGPTKQGSMRTIELIRAGQTIARVDLYNFLLRGDRTQDLRLQSGDTVFVPVIGPVAGISGAVQRPGIFEIKSNSDLSELIYLAGGFLPTSYLKRVQIKRILAHETRIVRDENVDMNRSVQDLDTPIQNMDVVDVLPIYEDIMNVVYLEGEVKYPGTVELRQHMRIKDLLPGPGVFTFNAHLANVEIIRTHPKTREINIYTVDLEKLYAGDLSQNIALESMDRVSVPSVIRKEGSIVLSGEIQRPGKYTFVPGERLSSVLKRAGGFTPDSYLFGAKFTRKSVKEAQTARTQALFDRLKEQILLRGREVISGALSDADRLSKEAQLKKSEELLELLESKVVEGRVIVRLDESLAAFAGTKDDIELEDGDVLHVPPISNVVLVLGEVYNPSSVVYNPNREVRYYLGQVGGPTHNADTGALYVIRADGSVISRRQGLNIMAAKLIPGDTIIVPQTLETFNFWVFLKEWTHWFYEMAIAFAVIGTYVK
jgi:polysaccharide export outer membrane protein